MKPFQTASLTNNCLKNGAHLSWIQVCSGQIHLLNVDKDACEGGRLNVGETGAGQVEQVQACQGAAGDQGLGEPP